MFIVVGSDAWLRSLGIEFLSIHDYLLFLLEFLHNNNNYNIYNNNKINNNNNNNSNNKNNNNNNNSNIDNNNNCRVRYESLIKEQAQNLNCNFLSMSLRQTAISFSRLS